MYNNGSYAYKKEIFSSARFSQGLARRSFRIVECLGVTCLEFFVARLKMIYLKAFGPDETNADTGLENRQNILRTIRRRSASNTYSVFEISNRLHANFVLTKTSHAKICNLYVSSDNE